MLTVTKHQVRSIFTEVFADSRWIKWEEAEGSEHDDHLIVFKVRVLATDLPRLFKKIHTIFMNNEVTLSSSSDGFSSYEVEVEMGALGVVHLTGVSMEIGIHVP